MRKSPEEQAKLYNTGFQKTGMDGNEWKVTADKNGVKRWKAMGKNERPQIKNKVASTKFSYIKAYDEPEKDLKIKKVKFDISMYGGVQAEIEFNTPKNINDAIKVVEADLSRKVTKKYFDSVKNDLPSNDSFKDYTIRADLLGNSIFLEQLKFTTSNGYVTMRLICGS